MAKPDPDDERGEADVPPGENPPERKTDGGEDGLNYDRRAPGFVGGDFDEAEREADHKDA